MVTLPVTDNAPKATSIAQLDVIRTAREVEA
jgi:hypothetical protein